MFETVDIEELGQDVINNLQERAAKKKIELEYKGSDAQVQGVRHVLYEMLYNITDNAIRYTPEGGEVRVFVGKFNGKPFFRVEDNGMGMEQEQAEKLITYQAKGYGLKNVNDRMCILYGEDYAIRILSKVGQGTRVDMRIPKEVKKDET